VSDVIQFLLGSNATSRISLGSTDLAYADIKMSDLYSGSQSQTGERSPFETVTPLDSKAVVRAIATEVTQGWSNQELSDLYRTHRLLALAGIVTEIDRGMTDEGDPWFVFMDVRNEVFVHFGRFNGAYMVSCQAHEKPVWGDSLADLVTKFSEALQLSSDSGADRHNVVSIAKRSKNTVLLHPGAALAALVWSIYLMSDEVAAASPSLVPNSEDDVPQAHLLTAAADVAVLPESAQKTMIATIKAVLTKQNLADHSDREASLGSQPFSPASGLSMKAVGLGLSLVAISVGLPLTNVVSDNASFGSDATPAKLFQIDGLLSNIKAAVQLAEVAAMQFQGDHPEHQNTEKVLTPLVVTPTTSETGVADIIVDRIVQSVPSWHEITMSQASYVERKIDNIDNTEKETTARSLNAEQASEIRSVKNEEQKKEPVSDSFLQRFDDRLESVVLTDIGRLTEYEFSQLVVINEETELVGLLNDPLQSNQYAKFDDKAREYLTYILQNNENVKMVALQNEIIFIHIDAFNMANIDDPIYAKSWYFDDGGVISTVGLKSDIAMFDLVA